jgi:hypothetical protein
MTENQMRSHCSTVLAALALAGCVHVEAAKPCACTCPAREVAVAKLKSEAQPSAVEFGPHGLLIPRATPATTILSVPVYSALAPGDWRATHGDIVFSPALGDVPK